MMNNKIYLLFLFCFLFLFACNKPCTQGTTTYNISSGDKSKIPYKGNDTLTFVRTTTNDTFTFYGTGWQSGFNTSYTAEDCPQKENREARILYFQSPTFSNSIILNLSIYDNSKYTSLLSINFQNITYEVGGVSGLGWYNNTITILQNTYNYVDSFSNNNLTPFPTNYMCYYNLQYGVLRMRLTNGEIWELIPKK